MQWVVATASFFASAVEFVEAFTIVLVVGVTVNWRSSLLGADEEAIYEETQAALRARGKVDTSSSRFDLFGFLLSYKSVLLEGLEVAFIVITFGVSAATSTVSRSSGIASAALGALLAGLLVILVGAIVRVPLAKVPENTLKFIVGIMLTTFGTFWTGEGFGVNWPLADVFLLILAAIYLGAAFLLITWLKRVKARAIDNQPVPTTQTQEVKP